MNESHIADLKKALFEATYQRDEAVRRLTSKHVGGAMDACETADQRLLLAERRLAEAEHRAFAVLVDCDLVWDIGYPRPTLLQTDSRTCLLFHLACTNGQMEFGQIEFDRCSSTSFGSPGDETFNGHPLYGSGFEGYRAMRVINSPWIAQLRKIDSVHARHNPDAFETKSHFIFPFHDSTFECVAHSFKTTRGVGPLSEAAKKIVEQIF
jgi:hypothetical protein